MAVHMKLSNSWRKTFCGDDRQKAFKLLHVNSRATQSRYKKGGLPSEMVILRMFILGYQMDRDAFLAWMDRLAKSDILS